MNKSEFRLLTPKQKATALKALTKPQRAAVLRDPSLFLFPKQVIEGNTRYILLRCGRRFGKSVAGGAYIAGRIYKRAKTLGLCGPTYNDVKNIMVPAIQRWFYGKDKPVYNNLRKILEFNSESEFRDVIIHCFTSDKEIRGYSLEALWCDEVGAWLGNSQQIKDRFESIDTCVSEGKLTQTIITTTPITIPLFYEWKRAIDSGDKRFKLITGTMMDNPYLTDEYKLSEIKKHGTSRRGLQEFFGKQLENLEGALFTKKQVDAAIEAGRCLTANDCILTLIAIDPALTSNSSSDETGIIVLGLLPDHRVLVLEDLSGRYTPKEWNDVAAAAFTKYDAAYIIAETNAGGDLVKNNLAAGHDELLPYIKGVHAKKSKILRAEPVSHVFEDKRVLFSRPFPDLEKQLVEYVGTDSVSPDRMDAFVYGVTELLIKNQDLNVFKPLSKTSDLSTLHYIKPQTYSYSLGIDIRPTTTSWILAGYNKFPQIDHNFYIFDFQSGPTNLFSLVEQIRKIIQEREHAVITATKEYVDDLKRYSLPVKETTADATLIEAFNDDLVHDRIKLFNHEKALAFSRMLKTFQYDGEALEKSGRFVLMQDDVFLNALLTAYSRSHHFVHKKTLENKPLTFEEKIFQQMKQDSAAMKTWGL